MGHGWGIVAGELGVVDELLEADVVVVLRVAKRRREGEMGERVREDGNGGCRCLRWMRTYRKAMLSL